MQSDNEFIVTVSTVTIRNAGPNFSIHDFICGVDAPQMFTTIVMNNATEGHLLTQNSRSVHVQTLSTQTDRVPSPATAGGRAYADEDNINAGNSPAPEDMPASQPEGSQALQETTPLEAVAHSPLQISSNEEQPTQHLPHVELAENVVQPMEEEVVCLICLQNQPDGKSDCGHHFHMDCIRPWVIENFSCSVCMRSLSMSLISPYP